MDLFLNIFLLFFIHGVKHPTLRQIYSAATAVLSALFPISLTGDHQQRQANNSHDHHHRQHVGISEVTTGHDHRCRQVALRRTQRDNRSCIFTWATQQIADNESTDNEQKRTKDSPGTKRADE